jgi:uncharacterized membrane protein YphA (DoxX/SURF4 family)
MPLAQIDNELVQDAAPAWPLGARLAFRFCVIYFTLYCLLTQIINSVFNVPGVDVPDFSTLPPMRNLILWVAAHVFHVSQPPVYQGSGSGDKIFDWVLVFVLLVFAVVSTAVWTALDRNRPAYPRLQTWFRLFLRVCLASQLISYGLVKIIPMQMPYPSLFTQIEPFSNLSPMGVLWASIGASQAYEMFAGCAELTAGILLIFPRTATLGALIAIADMGQVFMLNMTYDVPVKLLSFQLIVMSLLFLAPEFDRLASFFFLGRTVSPTPRTPLFATPRANRIALGVLAFLWLWMIGSNLYGAWDGWRKYGAGRPKSPLYGIWSIEKQTVDARARPLLVTEDKAWRRIIFDFPDYAYISRMDSSLKGYASTLDPQKSTISLTDPTNNKWRAAFKFARPSPDLLTLDGTVDGHPEQMELRRLDHTKFQLATRGFHWVQEYPYNR